MLTRLLAIIALAAGHLAANAQTALATRYNCLSCHAVEQRLVGPSFREIAARYRGDASALQRLRDKVIHGGGGAWGTFAMPANAVPPVEAEALVAWVLAGAVDQPESTATAPHKAAEAPAAAPRDNTTFASADLLPQGRYLVQHVMGCGNCHAGRTPDTQPIAGMELTGGRVYDLPAYRLQPRNLSSDEATGIGRWSVEDIVRAVTQGQRPNGTPLAPMMPFNFYQALTPADAQAVAAYLKSTVPVPNATLPAQYRQPWVVDRYPDAELRFDPAAMRQDKLLRGRYLAALAHCLDCHTPAVNGATHFDTDGGRGGKRFGAARVLAPNISSHPVAGLGNWTDAELRQALFKGRGKDGRILQYPMPWPYLAGLTADDRASLIVWLRSLPPRP